MVRPKVPAMIQTVSNFGGSGSLPVKSVCDLLWINVANSGCYLSCYVFPMSAVPPLPHHIAEGQLAD